MTNYFSYKTVTFVTMFAISVAAYGRTGAEGLFPYIYDDRGTKLLDDVSSYRKVNWKKLTAVSGAEYSGVAVIDLSFYDASLPKELGDINSDLCSGALINVSKNRKNAPAYVLTAGHCYVSLDGKMIESQEIIVDAPAVGRVEFKRFDGKANKSVSVKAKRWAYAAVKGNDIGLLELNATVGELEREGIRPLEISDVAPVVGEELVLVGIPRRSVPEKDQVLHLAECEFEGITSGFRIMTAGEVSRPTFISGGRMHSCSTTQGLSGGPIVSKSTGKIVGIVSASGGELLLETVQLHSEVLAQFKSFNLGSNSLPARDCFDKDGKIELSWSRCQLEKPCSMGVFSDAEACFSFQCKLGNGGACYDLVDLYPEKQEMVRKYAKLACKHGDPRGCFTQALDVAGPRNKKAFANALLYFDKACDGGFAPACYMSALIYVANLHGVSKESDISKNVTKGISLIESSCQRLNGLACGHLGEFYETGVHKPRTVMKALELYARACVFGGIDEYCVRTAALLDSEREDILQNMKGSRLNSNARLESMITHYLTEGCKLLNQVACLKLKNNAQGASVDPTGSADAKFVDLFQKSRFYEN